MTTTLEDMQFIVSRDVQDEVDARSVVNWCNSAQNEFMLRIFIPGTTTLVIDKTTLVYTGLPTTIRQFRRIRRQSDLDIGINRAYYPVYNYYNGNFEVPTAFTTSDTLLIDFYEYMKFFTSITDEIDIEDRFYPMYTNYIKAMYYQLPSTITKLGPVVAQNKYTDSMNMYEVAKKQVADYYVIETGIKKPLESGW